MASGEKVPSRSLPFGLKDEKMHLFEMQLDAAELSHRHHSVSERLALPPPETSPQRNAGMLEGMLIRCLTGLAEATPSELVQWSN